MGKKLKAKPTSTTLIQDDPNMVLASTSTVILIYWQRGGETNLSFNLNHFKNEKKNYHPLLHLVFGRKSVNSSSIWHVLLKVRDIHKVRTENVSPCLLVISIPILTKKINLFLWGSRYDDVMTLDDNVMMLYDDVMMWWCYMMNWLC